MARRIQPIFDRILSDSRIVGRERQFVESLQREYNRRKSLTPGRRRCLREIEARLDQPPVAIDASLEADLRRILSRASDAADRWAIEFTTSLIARLQSGRSLTAGQKNALNTVQARYSDETIAARENWASSFTSEMREQMEIVARYYRRTGPYYQDLIEKVLSDSDFVPTQRQWSKLVENKYAQKVLESTFSEPKYNVGQLVTYRSAAKKLIIDAQRPVVLLSDHRAVSFPECNLKGFVVAIGAQPVVSAARDCKVYTVLFLGQTTPTFVEERYLKKARR